MIGKASEKVVREEAAEGAMVEARGVEKEYAAGGVRVHALRGAVRRVGQVDPRMRFPSFHPPLDGVAPGEVMLINASVQGMPVYTGVMVLYADEESFTVMTAEGLPEAGWNTFSAYEDGDGTTVAQVQSLARQRPDLRTRF